MQTTAVVSKNHVGELFLVIEEAAAHAVYSAMLAVEGVWDEDPVNERVTFIPYSEHPNVIRGYN